MSDLRPKPIMATIAGKEYGILFSIEAIDELQDHFDISIHDIGTPMNDERNRYKNTAYVLMVLANAYIDILNDDGGKRPMLSESYVRKHTCFNDHKENVQKIYEAYFTAYPEIDPESVGANPQKSE